MIIIRALLPILFLTSVFSQGQSQVINLKNIYNQSISLFKNDNTIGHVFIFTTTDCPIANSYSPELIRLHKTFKNKNISFSLVYVDKKLSHDKTIKHVNDYGLQDMDHIFVDRSHQIVKLAKAEMTPQTAVFDKDQKLIYLGAINNLYSGYGDKKAKASKHYLKDVLQKLIDGKTLIFSQTETYGCYIPN